MKGLLGFAAGLVVGAVAGAYLVKDKIMADAKEEINEVREYYKSKKEDKKEEVKEEQEQPKEKEEYKEIANNYVNYNKPERIEQPAPQTMLNDAPYVIDVEEFGEEEEYDTMTLTYFADGVLVDDVDEVVEDPDVVVGLDNLKIFEEFGASAVYVRNEVWKTDFEILKDDWNWSDLQDSEKKIEAKIIEEKEKKPHQL